MNDNGKLGELYEGGDWGLEVKSPHIGSGPVFHNAIIKYPAHCLIVLLLIFSYFYFSFARHFLVQHLQTVFVLYQLVVKSMLTTDTEKGLGTVSDIIISAVRQCNSKPVL